MCCGKSILYITQRGLVVFNENDVYVCVCVYEKPFSKMFCVWRGIGMRKGLVVVWCVCVGMWWGKWVVRGRVCGRKVCVRTAQWFEFLCRRNFVKWWKLMMKRKKCVFFSLFLVCLCYLLVSNSKHLWNNIFADNWQKISMFCVMNPSDNNSCYRTNVTLHN